MTDNYFFSSQLEDDASIDSALADIEQAMVRFEQILSRHGRAVNGIKGSKRRKTTTKTIINNSLSRIFTLFAEQGQGDMGDIFSPTPRKTNRFPSSNGQFLADLLSSLQKIGGRNL